MFPDRIEAGRQLGKALVRFAEDRPIVLALPRGGVPVAFEVAQALRAPLDVVLVRKIGHPASPELAIGAVVDGGEPRVVIDRATAEALGVGAAAIDAAAQRARRELDRRERRFAGHRPKLALADRVVIVVDDGIATGHTMRAALQHVRAERPKLSILAVPVAPPETLVRLRPECDLVVCLLEPGSFRAVGQFYDDFVQVTDEEVVELLDRAAGSALPQQ
jgi:putative phosphoribosyl transferase